MKKIRISILIVMVFAASIAIAFAVNSSKIGEYLALRAYAQAPQPTATGTIRTTAGLNPKYVMNAIDPELQQPTAKLAKPDAITEVLKAEADASAAFDAAKARLEAAQANTRAVLFREMAEAGVRPSECTVTDAQGNSNPFACISRDPKTGVWTFKKIEKAEAKAKP